MSNNLRYFNCLEEQEHTNWLNKEICAVKAAVTNMIDGFAKMEIFRKGKFIIGDQQNGKRRKHF